jgi:hypothetical protein
MVVALHLEHRGLPVANVDHARILARALNDACSARRELAQVQARGLVRAMLVPHRREDAELGEARLPADQIEDALILLRLQAMLGDELGGDHWFGRAFLHSGAGLLG